MSTSKTALITGITGQDGAYLAQLLMRKGYTVHGLKRRASNTNTQRIDHLYEDPHTENPKLILHYGDVTDSTSIARLLKVIRPDEIYHLAAQPHVRVSFDAPEYTTEVNALGTLKLLEAVRLNDLEEKTRIYNAATSEIFGNAEAPSQNESTPFKPRSPYGVAKLAGYWSIANYRDGYGMHAVNGILFNHESPVRGITFAPRKITRAAARISLGIDESLYLGNLSAKRDWGHTREFVEGMWKILNHDTPEDFVLATGKATSVREFAKLAFSYAGVELEFKGKNQDEIGVCKKSGKTLIKVDPNYYRPSEVNTLCGDPSKAKDVLGWEPSITVNDLCKEMVEADLYRCHQQLQTSRSQSAPIEKLVHHPGGFLAWMREQKINTFSET